VQIRKIVKYAPEIEAKLDVARRLFIKFDEDKDGYLKDQEISNLLKETYFQIGITYEPT